MQSMTEPTYLLMTKYNALVGTLLSVAPILNIAPCPFAGRVTENEIKAVLGERCDIWPESIREMAEED